MSTGTTKAPTLPLGPVEYSQIYQNQLINLLRMYFTQLDNAGPSAATTLYRGELINSALNFSVIDAVGIQKVSLPTQVDIAKLRIGDLYYDTTADNVLKVKV